MVRSCEAIGKLNFHIGNNSMNLYFDRTYRACRTICNYDRSYIINYTSMVLKPKKRIKNVFRVDHKYRYYMWRSISLPHMWSWPNIILRFIFPICRLAIYKKEKNCRCSQSAYKHAQDMTYYFPIYKWMKMNTHTQ